MHITDGKLLKKVIAAVLLLGISSPGLSHAVWNVTDTTSSAATAAFMEEILTISAGGDCWSDENFDFIANSTDVSEPDIPSLTGKGIDFSYEEQSKYQEDMEDAERMQDMEEEADDLIDVDLVGTNYVYDSPNGRVHVKSYQKYGNVIINLSRHERKIINSAWNLIITIEGLGFNQVPLNSEVTLEQLFELAFNIRSLDYFSNSFKLQLMRILDKYVYY